MGGCEYAIYCIVWGGKVLLERFAKGMHCSIICIYKVCIYKVRGIVCMYTLDYTVALI